MKEYEFPTITHLEHNGHKGSIEYSETDQVYHGKVQDTVDLITYEGESVWELVGAFIEAVEDYINLKDRYK